MPWGLGCPYSAGNSSVEACTWSTDAENYRKLKEVAYLNHEGSNAFSCVALMLVYPLTVILHLHAAGVVARTTNLGLLHNAIWVVCELTAATLPLVFAFSSPHLVRNSLIMHSCVCAFFAAYSKPLLAWPRYFSQFLASRAARRAGTAASNFTYIDEKGEKIRFVAEYRAVIMITTCVAILAVDFPALFSRTHAKTEEFGYSLMDLGTGSFIIASAVCSKTARGRGNVGRLQSLLKQAAKLRPILLLGCIRFFSLWGIDYHVPTSEYGVHWNFFFTIAALSFVASVADLGSRASGVAGVLLLVCYQAFLSLLGGGDYILHAPRLGPFSANKEGILSCAGYLGIHWLGVAIGSHIRSARPASDRASRMLLFALGGFAITAALDALGVPVSHRMCNLPYATFVLGVNALVMGLLAWIDLEWPRPRPPLPLVYGGIQDSMFATFLLANLLTGAVNVLLQPLLIPAGAALLIMFVYTLVFTLPFAICRYKGVVLKFW